MMDNPTTCCICRNIYDDTIDWDNDHNIAKMVGIKLVIKRNPCLRGGQFDSGTYSLCPGCASKITNMLLGTEPKEEEK